MNGPLTFNKKHDCFFVMSYITKNMIRKNAKNMYFLTLLHKDFFAWTYTKYYSSSPLNHMKESPSSFTVHNSVRSFLEGHSAFICLCPCYFTTWSCNIHSNIPMIDCENAIKEQQQRYLEPHFSYKFSILGCFGQSGLRRKKKFKSPQILGCANKDLG